MIWYPIAFCISIALDATIDRPPDLLMAIFASIVVGTILRKV